MTKASAHVYVSGIVQGVFFRSNTRRQALIRGLNGWVRNLPDGRVEAVFEGEEEAVKNMVEWCRGGPPYAAVDDMEVHWEPYREKYEQFEVR